MLSDLKPTSWLMFWLHFISDKLFMRQSRKYFKRVAWIPSDHLHLQWKFKLWAGKFAWGIKAKHYWALSTNFWKQKVCWHHPAMFCLITSSKFSRQWFEFSLKVKVMRLNPVYLLKFFLLYLNISKFIILCNGRKRN